MLDNDSDGNRRISTKLVLSVADSPSISFDLVQLDWEFPRFSIGRADFFYFVSCKLWDFENVLRISCLLGLQIYSKS